jgi:uncharacterized membrane protein
MRTHITAAMGLTHVSAAFFIAAMALPATAQPAGFHIIPNILTNGTRDVRATGLSADGRTIIGTASTASHGAPDFGFAYRLDGLRINFGELPGVGGNTTEIGPNAVSSDGRYIVGYRGNGPLPGSIFRLDLETMNFLDLGTLPGYESALVGGVSADGATVVGDFTDATLGDFDRQAVKWTPGGGIQGLGRLRPNHFAGTATAVSADGNITVGHTWDPTFHHSLAFRHTDSGGLQELPSLPPAWFGPASQAVSISPNGAFIVGTSVAADLLSHAVMWDDSGIIDLGMFPAGQDASAMGVSNGGLVVGAANALVGSGITNIGFVWERSVGLQYVGDYLIANGVSLPAGSLLIDCVEVSADGRTFLGTGTSPTLGRFNYVATVPGPSTCSLIALTFVGTCRQRRRRALDQPVVA